MAVEGNLRASRYCLFIYLSLRVAHNNKIHNTVYKIYKIQSFTKCCWTPTPISSKLAWLLLDDDGNCCCFLAKH